MTSWLRELNQFGRPFSHATAALAVALGIYWLASGEPTLLTVGLASIAIGSGLLTLVAMRRDRGQVAEPASEHR